MYHDLYHCVRASKVSLAETNSIVLLGHALESMQSYITSKIKVFKIIHEKHRKNIEKDLRLEISKIDSTEEKEKIIKNKVDKFNYENKIIKFLSLLNSYTGKLKFKLYDMELLYSGSQYDVKDNSSIKSETRFMLNVQALVLQGMPHIKIKHFSNIIRFIMLSHLRESISLYESLKEAVKLLSGLSFQYFDNLRDISFYRILPQYLSEIDLSKKQSFITDWHKVKFLESTPNISLLSILQQENITGKPMIFSFNNLLIIKDLLNNIPRDLFGNILSITSIPGKNRPYFQVISDIPGVLEYMFKKIPFDECIALLTKEREELKNKTLFHYLARKGDVEIIGKLIKTLTKEERHAFMDAKVSGDESFADVLKDEYIESYLKEIFKEEYPTYFEKDYPSSSLRIQA